VPSATPRGEKAGCRQLRVYPADHFAERRFRTVEVAVHAHDDCLVEMFRSWWGPRSKVKVATRPSGTSVPSLARTGIRWIWSIELRWVNGYCSRTLTSPFQVPNLGRDHTADGRAGDRRCCTGRDTEQGGARRVDLDRQVGRSLSLPACTFTVPGIDRMKACEFLSRRMG